MTSHELEVALDMIPVHCRHAMRYYIENGRRPGEFLSALLMNNLFLTFAKADDINRVRIDDYIKFLIWHAPPNCFGSRAKVEAWIEDAAERRAMANVVVGRQP